MADGNGQLPEWQLELLGSIESEFRVRRLEVLRERGRVRRLVAAGRAQEIVSSERDAWESDWRVLREPTSRRVVELSGPATAEMVQLVAGAGVDLFMMDLEDQLPPGWSQLLAAHNAVFEARERGIPLAVRPRSLHSDEPAVCVDGVPVSAALFDVALYLGRYVGAPTGAPHLYLPKCESRLEAILWRDAISAIEQLVGLPPGVSELSVLIETVGGAVSSEAILFELRDRATALNAGVIDFLFSFAMTFRDDPRRSLHVGHATTDDPLCMALNRRVLDVAHRRGALAIGGMTGSWPRRGRPTTLERRHVRAAKASHGSLGFDGSTIAHPAFAAEARAGVLEGARSERESHADAPLAFLDVPRLPGNLSESVLLHRVKVLVGILERWLAGEAPIVIDGQAEELAGAEFARIQLWAWARHHAVVEGNGVVDASAVSELVDWTAADSTHPKAHAARELARALVLGEPPSERIAEVSAHWGRAIP
jgi:malate synthase